MDTFLLRVFQRQVATQCFAALTAAKAAEGAIGALTQDVFWAQIQGCLTAVANISKALYGQRGKFEKEREPLRASLRVVEPSPLRATSMRNNFEHFDERIDEWYRSSSHRNHLDFMIGEPAAIVGLADRDMFRVFVPTTGELVFWGKRYPLRDIVTEVQRLHPIALA